MLLVWFVWIVTLNGPHLFAMYSRTALDRSETQIHHRILLRSFLLYLPGLLVLLSGSVLRKFGVSWSGAPFAAYLVSFALWSFLHVVRQHQGIANLYRKKNAETEDWDRRIDSMFLSLGLGAPYLSLFATHPMILSELPFGFYRIFGADWLPIVRFSGPCIGILILAILLLRQCFRWARAQPFNGPKFLFMTSIFIYYFFVSTSDIVRNAPLFAPVPFFVIPHDLQYHALVRVFNRSKRAAVYARNSKLSLGLRLTRNFPLYAICGLLVGTIMAVLSCGIDRDLACPSSFYNLTVLGDFPLREILVVVFQSLMLQHYFVDSFIWKAKNDPRVPVFLGVTTPPYDGVERETVVGIPKFLGSDGT